MHIKLTFIAASPGASLYLPLSFSFIKLFVNIIKFLLNINSFFIFINFNYLSNLNFGYVHSAAYSTICNVQLYTVHKLAKDNMSQTGSNLRLSHLHPLRPIHTNQSQPNISIATKLQLQ